MKTLKCDICGRFISYTDLENNKAIHRMITPDSVVSEENFETLCRDHYKLLRAVAQQTKQTTTQ